MGRRNFSSEEEGEWNLNSREKRMYFSHVILKLLGGKSMPFGVKRLVMCRFGQVIYGLDPYVSKVEK